MQEGQNQFLSYILSRVTDEKREAAEKLLTELFRRQEEKTFDAAALRAANEVLLSMVKPEYLDEVSGILSKHGEEHLST